MIFYKVPRIIAFTGPMGSGKSTAMELLKTELGHLGLSAQVLKFAGPLYEMQKEVYRVAGLPNPKEKDRKLLQWLGTEWGRSIDENLWVNNFTTRINYDFNTTLTDDCRFINEVNTVKSHDGVIVKMLGPQRTELINTSHQSEKGIPDELVDYSIRNDQDLEYLTHNIRILSRYLIGQIK